MALSVPFVNSLQQREMPGKTGAVALRVLHAPGAVWQEEPGPLADGVEPKALVKAELLPSLLLQDQPRPLSEVLLDELAELHLPKEADP